MIQFTVFKLKLIHFAFAYQSAWYVEYMVEESYAECDQMIVIPCDSNSNIIGMQVRAMAHHDVKEVKSMQFCSNIDIH